MKDDPYRTEAPALPPTPTPAPKPKQVDNIGPAFAAAWNAAYLAQWEQLNRFNTRKGRRRNP